MTYPDRSINAPTELAGCVLWLDAAVGVTLTSGFVSAWTDRSPSANHAIQAADATRRPVVATVGATTVIRFDGSNDLLHTTTNITATAQSIFAVARLRAVPTNAYRVLVLTQKVSVYASSADGAGNLGVYMGGIVSSGEKLSTSLGVVSAVVDATRYTNIRMGLAEKRRGGQGAAFTGQATTEIGATSGTQAADLDLAELVVFDRALTDGEVAQVERYLAKKYALHPVRLIASPLELPDCAMWFDAGAGVTYDGNGVSVWADQSGNARNIAQSNNSFKPTYNASNAAFGGKPTVDWDTVGNGDRLDRGAETLAQPLTIFVCANIANATATNILMFDNATGAELVFGRKSGTEWYFYAGFEGRFPTPPVGTRPFVASVIFNGVDSRVSINGAAAISRFNVGTQAFVDFRLGTAIAGYTTYNWNGSIAEFLVYRRRLTDGEIALVEQYLARKYKLPSRLITAPTEFPDCTLWLDSTDLASITQSGGLVSQWSDKSGLAAHFTAASTFRPTYTATGIDFNGVGNRLYGPVTSALITASAYSIFVVFNADVIDTAGASYANDALIADGSGFFGIHLASGTPPNALAYNWDGSADVSRGAIALGQKTLATSVHGAGQLELYVNGVRQAASPSGDTTNVTINLVIGTGGSNYYDGKILEIVAFNRKLSDGERIQVERYLANKYALPI